VGEDWGTGTGGFAPPPRPPDDGGRPQDASLPGWMRRAPSSDYGSSGRTRRERAQRLADKVRGRPPLNAPVYAYSLAPAEKQSFWSAGKGVLLGAGFAAGSLAIALTLVALVRTDPDDTVTDPDSGLAIAGDPTTTQPGAGFDGGKVPLETPTSDTSTTVAPSTETTEPAETTDTTESPGTTADTAPVTAPPATTPVTTAPPTTTPPTTRPPTTQPPAPVISSFRADRASSSCWDRDEVSVRFSWSTTNASSARLGREGRSTQNVGTNAQLQDCVRRSSTWVLTVSGPGGQTSRTVQAPS
jgi:hypothetical protein